MSDECRETYRAAPTAAVVPEPDFYRLVWQWPPQLGGTRTASLLEVGNRDRRGAVNESQVHWAISTRAAVVSTI